MLDLSGTGLRSLWSQLERGHLQEKNCQGLPVAKVVRLTTEDMHQPASPFRTLLVPLFHPQADQK